MASYHYLAGLASLLVLVACGSTPPEVAEPEPVPPGPGVDWRLRAQYELPRLLPPGALATDCGFDELPAGLELGFSGVIRERLVPIGAVEFATSVATLRDTDAERVSNYFDLLRADRFARAIFLVGVSRGAVEDELVQARLHAVREAIERRADPTWGSSVEERVEPTSDDNPPDTVRVFLLCPASRPSP